MKTNRLAIKRQSGFTLVELLVVIVIIGMLVALLVPAVNAARESARQAQCMNNQKELSTAVQEYTVAKGRYPGFENADRDSWIVVLLPSIGRNDLMQEIRHYTPRTRPDLGVTVGQFVCPDVRVTGNQPLSYVANHRVFRNRFSNSNGNSISPEDVPNQQITPMISERTNPTGENNVGKWTPFDSANGTNLSEWQQDAQQVTFDWPYIGATTYRLMDLNATTSSPAFLITGSGENQDIRSPTPSSNHPGIVIVTFCDGHADKIRVDRPLEANVFNPGPAYPIVSGTLSYGY